MARLVKQYRLFIATPSDVKEEKEIISLIVNEWNIQIGRIKSVNVEAVNWSTHSYPDIGERPQEIINQQILNESDIVVGVFWTKFGSPTGEEESGTEEELKRGIQQNNKVMVYFSDIPISLSKVDNVEYQKIIRFKEEFKDKGLYFTYSSSSEFRELFRRHLAATMDEILSSNTMMDQEIEISFSEKYWTIILASIGDTIQKIRPVLNNIKKEGKTEKDLSETEVTILAGPIIIRGKIVDELHKLGIISKEGEQKFGLNNILSNLNNEDQKNI